MQSSLNSIAKNNGIKDLKNQAKDGASKWLKTWSAVKKTINFGAIYVGAKQAFNTLKGFNDEAVNYSETLNLFNVSFGKGLNGLNQYYKKAINFQETLEEKLGINIEESMRYQALFNSMTKSMGLGAEYAYTLSENMTKLGYDLASLYNIDPEEAMTKLRAGLAGETEPLRALGLDITEQSLEPVAQSLGIKESIRNMSQAEKTVLRYITVLRQAQIAQGDFANTIESQANQLRIFNAQITSFKRNMGNLWQGILGGILPYVNAVMMVINELLKMVAKLFGFEVSEQPVNISANVGADDLANDLGTASGKAKELKNQLMGFDEINNITLDKSSSGSSADVNVGGIDKRLLDALDDYNNKMDEISNKATEIRDKILDWLGVTDGTYTNLKKIGEIVGAIGIGLTTWKVSSVITNLLKNLGLMNKTQSFRWAFGLTLLLTGIFAQYRGTKHLLDGDVDLFTILETVLGTTGGALGIVSILKATKKGKTLSLGNKLKVGFGLMLGIQGVQVFLDGINEGDIKKTLLGAFEGVTSLSVAFNGLFGKKLIQSIKNTTASISIFGIGVVKSFKDARASGLSLSKSFLEAGSTAKDLIGKGKGLVAGLAGIAGGSALTYSAMKDLATGEAESAEGALKLAGGLGLATASGVLAGSQFGTLGMIIGGVAGLTTSAITAFVGYKEGIESLNIPTSTLTDDIKQLTEEIDANREAHEQAVKSIKDTYENQLVEAEYANRLSDQLLGLVDANGKVKKGNEERVEFILGELNSALGTEYELNGNLITKNGEVVDSYKDLQDSIKDTIEAKKKEAEQTAIAELYKESIKEQIQLELDREKAYQEYTKAYQKYNDLMALNLGDWTLTHDERCKQIIEDLNNTSDAYWDLVEQCEGSTEEVSRLSQMMTDNIIEDTGVISKEMITQEQVSSETLQSMVLNNTKVWEESYNNLGTLTQSAMLAQSTTLDNWSPTLEEKWKNMANNSINEFLLAIAQVEPSVQSQILLSVTSTENLTPQMAQAWINLANTSITEFSTVLSQLTSETQNKLLGVMTQVQGSEETMAQVFAGLARTSKDEYNRALASLDTDTASKIESAVIAINNKQEMMNRAGRDLIGEGLAGARAKISDPKNGVSAMASFFVSGFVNKINSRTSRRDAFEAGDDLVSSALQGGNERQRTGSPAKETIKMGNFYTEGYILGIKKNISQVKKVSAELVGTALEELDKVNTKGFTVDTNDFSIDTNQFIDYGQINGAIQTQSNVSLNTDFLQQIYRAVIEGMRNARIQVEIEAKTEKGIMFKTVKAEAEEFAIQTGENPFPVLA